MPKVLVALDESDVSVHVARAAKRLFAGPGTQFLAISVATVPTLWADPFGGVHTLKGDYDGDDDILSENENVIVSLHLLGDALADRFDVGG